MRYNSYVPDEGRAPRSMTRYNVRSDNLQSPWWSNAFRVNHGFVWIHGFRENVAVEKLLTAGRVSLTDIENWFENYFALMKANNPKYRPSVSFAEPLLKRSIDIDFFLDDPKGKELLIPVIFAETILSDGNNDFGAAIVTGDATDSIKRAGHDRRPIVLKADAISKWENSVDQDIGDIRGILATSPDWAFGHKLPPVSAKSRRRKLTTLPDKASKF